MLISDLCVESFSFFLSHLSPAKCSAVSSEFLPGAVLWYGTVTSNDFVEVRVNYHWVCSWNVDGCPGLVCPQHCAASILPLFLFSLGHPTLCSLLCSHFTGVPLASFADSCICICVWECARLCVCVCILYLTELSVRCQDALSLLRPPA